MLSDGRVVEWRPDSIIVYGIDGNIKAHLAGLSDVPGILDEYIRMLEKQQVQGAQDGD
jgi:hypothetical protein